MCTQCVLPGPLLVLWEGPGYEANLENVEASVKSQVKSLTSADRQSIFQEVASHPCVSKDVNWLRVWDAARDKGQFWTGIAQGFYKLLTTPVWTQELPYVWPRHPTSCQLH